MTRDQFEAYAQSSQRGLRRFLTALCCGDSQLADDIAQEALIKAYLSCDGFRDPSKFTAWIFRIGYNTFLNSRRAVREHAGYDEIADVPSASSAESAFRYQELYRALGRLTANERMAILLFYMEGYSVKEIAAIIESSQDAVKQYLSRGRRHLHDLIGAER